MVSFQNIVLEESFASNNEYNFFFVCKEAATNTTYRFFIPLHGQFNKVLRLREIHYTTYTLLDNLVIFGTLQFQYVRYMLIRILQVEADKFQSAD